MRYSFHGGVRVLPADSELDLSDAALETDQVLLELGLLLLDATHLVLQFHIFDFLSR